MKLCNYDHNSIKWLARCAVVRAYHKLRRRECLGEAERFRYWFGDDHRQDAEDLIQRTLPKLIDADVRQIIRELATILCCRALEAEYNYRTKSA